MKSTTSRGKSKKKIRIELTPLSAFAWGCGLFFLISWFFALGIMVGRGFIPDAAMDIAEIKTRIKRIQKTIGSQNKEIYPVKRHTEEDRKLEFYKILTEKKRELSSAPLTPHSQKEEKSYTVQFASLREKRKAKEMVDKLRVMGYDVYFYRAHIKGFFYYRVRSKKRFTLENARQFVRRIRSKHKDLNPIVTRVETDDTKGN